MRSGKNTFAYEEYHPEDGPFCWNKTSKVSSGKEPMLKVLELFAGIGAASKALENLGIEHESAVISNTQLYKTAGNSIVVNVLEAILKELL